MLDDDTEIHPLFEGAPKTTEFKKLRKPIRHCMASEIHHLFKASGSIDRNDQCVTIEAVTLWVQFLDDLGAVD